MQTYADCTPMRFAWQLRSKQRTENGLGLRSFIFLNDSTFHSDIDVCFQYVSESYVSSIYTSCPMEHMELLPAVWLPDPGIPARDDKRTPKNARPAVLRPGRYFHRTAGQFMELL